MTADDVVRPDAILDAPGVPRESIVASTRTGLPTGERTFRPPPGAMALQIAGALWPREVRAIVYRPKPGGYHLLFDLGERLDLALTVARSPAAALAAALALEGP